MGTRHISLPDDMERQLKEIADRRQIPTEALIADVVEGYLFLVRGRWLRLALSAIGISLLTALLVVFFLRVLPLHVESPTGPSVWELIVQFLHFLRSWLELFIPWPATILLVAWLFFRSRTAFSTLLDIFRLFRKVKILGTEIELSDQTRRKLQAVTDEIVDALRAYGKRVNQEVSRSVRNHHVTSELSEFLDSVYETFGRMGPETEFRCTIHIEHPIYDGELYQLLDYQPRGTGAFRHFSDRYGIIGKVWRSGIPQLVGNLIGDTERNLSYDEKVAHIMQNWGMTRTEAEHALTKPSYICFPLEHDGQRIGVVYMDSKVEDAFQILEGAQRRKATKEEEETLLGDLRQTAKESLGPKVSAVVNDLTSASLRLDLRDY